MKAKKNPKKDLNKTSGVFFATGMFIVLALTYISLEWKTFYNSDIIQPDGIAMENELEEEVPIFIMETLPPPPVTTIIIEVVENDPEILDTVIAPTDTNQDDEIKYEDIEVAEEPEDVDVDFIRVEQVPVFPGCEKKEDKRACFNEMMTKHVRKNFRYPEIAQEMGIQGKVYVRFVIQKDGSIGNLQLRGTDKNLEAEAARIIDKLPKMTPSKQRVSPVRVPFNLPLTFKLN